ncbi:AAA-ATPase [Microbacterium phage Knox]|uniref:AAA-ATPase n=5 Tax=Ilzatvirus teagan TaxID=2845595 RepID=A0A2U8UIL0_9CAUD|nr:AAA-ATPase [Microbacterium phage Knox]AWN03492.1 AAA-ATPase [Microbacterium phage Gargoyle]QDM56961.1 AAA-ATPase [Microbacterium phage BonesMcCoy]QJD50540.1 AAA-ATPase [Microbacterium phage BeautPeep30]QJD51626.1 AAA-ATPase [Microbacterium phage Convict]QKY79280.1 RecA-like DNA Recombinase [Microbacterium phage BigRedClifford]UVK60213.1 AAA-ATPase [Microbacterium phage Phireproof]UVK62641.1 AAA-ATPase [Microbacterium phage Thompsone]WNT45206.1 RecA-like DNA recombinase [Microbacterium ph
MTVYTIYSRPKVGKTTFALKDAPKGKTAVISADQGLIGFDLTGITVEEDMSTKNLNKLMNGPFLRSHNRIILDTATSLHSTMLFDMTHGAGASQAQYGTANSALLAIIRQLRNEKAKQSIILAQEKLILPNEEWVSEDTDEDTGVMTTVDLSPGAASGLLQMSDVIGRLYIAHVNDKPVRRLWLGPSSSIVSGARSKVYSGNPAFLKQPTVGRLNQLLGWTR